MHLGLRVRRAHLQTAVRTLHRGQDGRTITLVGTCHIGERAYFDKLAEHVALLEGEGALVHCEAAYGATPDADAAPLTAEQKTVRHMLTVADELTTRRVAEVLGWTRQKLVLTSESWINPDMSMGEVQRESDGDLMRQYAEGRLQDVYWQDGDTIAALRWHVHTTDFLRLTATNRRSAQARINGGPSPVVVKRRRQLAIDAAMAAIGQGRDLVMVWDAGHQPAMLGDLAGHGFTCTGPAVWHTVGKLLTLPRRMAAVWKIRAAVFDGYEWPILPTNRVGFTKPIPAWVYEMNEPDDEHGPEQQPAVASGKETGTAR